VQRVCPVAVSGASAPCPPPATWTAAVRLSASLSLAELQPPQQGPEPGLFDSAAGGEKRRAVQSAFGLIPP